MATTLVKNGTLVTAHGVSQHDVLIEGETISAVGPGLDAPPGSQVVDADGLLVFPGLVDPHVHLREPGGEHKEDFVSGTQAALVGGFTMVLVMPNTTPPLTDAATLRQTHALAAAKVVCDVGFYVGATADNVEEAAALAGVVGLKLYMGSSTGSLLVADLAGQAEHFGQYRGVVAVHAEDESAVAHFAQRDIRRPPICAALAVSRALALAAEYGTRLHVCHVSTAHELALIRDAKARGMNVTCEVAPHHLFLTAEDGDRLGALGQMNPPLRPSSDVEALWANLDIVDCLATDHAPHTLQEKHSETPPSGVPGLETALPLMLTAVHEGKVTLEDVARLMAEGPSRAFGLERKGHIRSGGDADLTLVEPQAEWIIGERPLHTRCGWSPFEAKTVRGRVTGVFLRGRQVYGHGEVLVRPGFGRIRSTTTEARWPAAPPG
jgi:dihydroorotase (multifunctional complex type)